MKTKSILLSVLSAVLTLFLLAGCGESKELAEFRTSFEAFCSDVAGIDASINSIDATADDAVPSLLALLDELDVKFQELAALEVPEEFAYMEDLADEASENMTLAIENYHLAYEAEIYDASAAGIASQYYERAYKRIQYMITFMHGEVPDDENVQIHEE